MIKPTNNRKRLNYLIEILIDEAKKKLLKHNLKWILFVDVVEKSQFFFFILASWFLNHTQVICRDFSCFFWMDHHKTGTNKLFFLGYISKLNFLYFWFGWFHFSVFVCSIFNRFDRFDDDDDDDVIYILIDFCLFKYFTCNTKTILVLVLHVNNTHTHTHHDWIIQINMSNDDDDPHTHTHIHNLFSSCRLHINNNLLIIQWFRVASKLNIFTMN